MTYSQTFIRSVWGGLLLGFAGVSSVLMSSEAGILKPLIFPLGLILIVFSGYQLFTGNVYNFWKMGLTTQKNFVGLFISWLGNLLGSIYACIFCGITATETELNIFRNIAASKVEIPYADLLVSAICANFLVCLAVHLWQTRDDPLTKVVGVFGPVFLFVSLGFEHVVADMVWFMYYPIGPAIPFFIFTTLGNLIGGYILCFAVQSCKT